MTGEQKISTKSSILAVIASSLVSFGVARVTFDWQVEENVKNDFNSRIEQKADKTEVQNQINELKKDFQAGQVRIEGKIDKIYDYLLNQKTVGL